MKNKKTNVICLKAGALGSLFLMISLSTIPIVIGGLSVDSHFDIDYDMLILVPNYAIKDQFQPLKELHDAEGIDTRIRVLNNPSLRTPESVRTIIKNAYETSGIEYVLIAGNNNLFPTYYESASQRATDQYFACLDEPFFHDYVAEVYVGRAPIDNEWDAERFVSKTLAYYHDGDNQHLQKVLMVGEQLDAGVYGSSYMEALRTLIPSSYVITTLYDIPGYFWPASEIINRINNAPGVHIINHLGHGDAWCGMKLSVPGHGAGPYLTSLTNAAPNNDLFFVYSQACDIGAFDIYDCWAKYITVDDRDGAFAVIANTGEGYYNQADVNDSPSQLFHAAFLTESLEHDLPIGQANQVSKTNAYGYGLQHGVNVQQLKACYFQTTLFGDPAIRLH